MKKAFTMIELIFVIVILGILAAVAIPKLNATRDDAELAKANTNLTTLIGDITSYYTSKGEINPAINLQQITGVQLYNDSKGNPAKTGGAAWMGVKDHYECLYVKVNKNSNGETYMAFAKGRNMKANSVCEKFNNQIDNSGVFANGYSDMNFKNPTSTLSINFQTPTYFRLGGSGVLW